MTEALDKHYDAVAASYQQAWFYEDGTEYQRWLARQAAVSGFVGRWSFLACFGLCWSASGCCVGGWID